MIGKAPVAVVVAPDWVSVTGTTTSLLTPLIASLPAISYLPPPSALIVPDWKVAFGNLAALNQTGFGSSASASLLIETLARSTLNAILLAAGLAGSKAIWPSNWRKRPSTGTPICLLTKVISLCAGTSFCCAWAGTRTVAAARPMTAERIWCFT